MGWISGCPKRSSAWHDRAIAFAQAELQDDLLGRDERREFWREGWTRCAGFGFQGLPVAGRNTADEVPRLPETIARDGKGSATAASTTA